MDEPAHAVAVLSFGDHQPGVARGDAQLQRGLHVLGDVDRDDRRAGGHHLAGLLLVQMEHAPQHPRLARVELPAGVGLGDQALELVGGARAGLLAHVDPEHPQNPGRDGCDPEDDRVKQDPEPLQRAGDPASEALRAVDRVELGHHLPRDQLHGGDHHERQHHRDRHRHPVRQAPAEGALERARERRRPQGANPDRGHRDPDLDGGYVVVDALQLSERQRGPPQAFVAHHLQARPARAHECVLGDHEERVDGDQQGREDQLQPGHARPCGAWDLLLRGGSSSFIGGRRANGSRGTGRLGGLQASPSIRAASAKSASVRPPSEWVESSRRTLFQPCTRMSGWWLASCGDLGHAVDERDRGGEVRELVLACDRLPAASPLAAREAPLDLLL